MALRQISLQDSVVYGPVKSRRLGNSLGINPLPLGYKLCSSNCVYCQYGWTYSDRDTPEPIKRAPELLSIIEETFQEFVEEGTPIDCITLAGNGEPTLHPDLEELVLGIKRLRDQYFPYAKVGILSDGTQAHRPKVRQALEQLDERYMKLDAGDEETWRLIDQPLGSANWKTLIETLKSLPGIVLQCMFIQGSSDNTQDDHIGRWIELVASIRPRAVQVYTIDRTTAASGIEKVPRERLETIAKQLTTRTGIPAEVYD